MLLNIASDGRVAAIDILAETRGLATATSRLVAVLHPDAVLRVDFGPAGRSRVVHGPEEIAKSAIMFASADTGDTVHSVLVNGAAGQISFRDGTPFGRDTPGRQRRPGPGRDLGRSSPPLRRAAAHRAGAGDRQHQRLDRLNAITRQVAGVKW